MALKHPGVREAPGTGDPREEGAAVEVRVGPQGRIVIPASLRRQSGIEPTRIEDDRLELGAELSSSAE